MDANIRQLEAIFDPNVFFQVPLFQRPYVWNEAENWEYLWEDIRALLDRQLRTGKTRTHFLGAIVLEQLPHPAGSIETRQVIDGQQRFTTLQIFLMAARNLAGTQGAGKYAERFAALVENNPSRVEDPVEKFKLWPTNSDRTPFKIIHGCKSLQDLDQKVKGKPTLASNNLVGAYRYFHGKLAAWLVGQDDDEDDKAELASKTVEDRIESLWQVVKGGLQLVVINLDPDDETQVIFETLNARGTELLPADLIKNYLFRKALVQNAEVEGLYEDHWARFEAEFWRKEVQQGRIKRPRIDLFINHYLTLMTRDEVKSTHLFNAFKSFVENAEPLAGSKVPVPADAAGHIRQLARYADVFDALQNPNGHPVLAQFMRRLEAVDTATVLPFLLHAYAELMPDDQSEFDKVLSVLESFLMRRLITNFTPKNYNRLFVDLIKAVERSGETMAKAVALQLGKGTGESTKFPSDMELLTAVCEWPLYGRIAQYKVRAVLEALDAAEQSTKSPVLALPANLTIEHVLPQTWQTHWPLPAEAKVDPATEQKATARREVMLNTLGNLTLITGSFNSSLQNAAWGAKRPELLRYAKINLTQYFYGPEADDWHEDAIRKRNEHMFGLLLKVWPDAGKFAA
ncbi:DUF262 domain-containing protein [Luteibacter sp. SG786]|uniref:DUF262 domain-containing protein n=1 Tax=Luteibacter sp. SG786 TaxID=2587130 RepID=UPI00142431D9|nr:DUF262 domain-containing protein [Luteibacter sp. SG786]NII55389.1 hypothetical protein [Luteibacter sp. SG786]